MQVPFWTALGVHLTSGLLYPFFPQIRATVIRDPTIRPMERVLTRPSDRFERRDRRPLRSGSVGTRESRASLAAGIDTAASV
jgi:hypothetical protein